LEALELPKLSLDDADFVGTIGSLAAATEDTGSLPRTRSLRIPPLVTLGQLFSLKRRPSLVCLRLRIPPLVTLEAKPSLFAVVVMMLELCHQMKLRGGSESRRHW
jgi:hypothetical protein